jgi:hypothetical protein
VPEVFNLFTQLGFPAAVAAVLLYFAWHVSRILLKSHQEFLESIRGSYERQEQVLREISEVMLKHQSALEAIMKMVTRCSERELVAPHPRPRSST